MEGSDNGYSTSLENWRPWRDLWVRISPPPHKFSLRSTSSLSGMNRSSRLSRRFKAHIVGLAVEKLQIENPSRPFFIFWISQGSTPIFFVLTDIFCVPTGIFLCPTYYFLCPNQAFRDLTLSRTIHHKLFATNWIEAWPLEKTSRDQAPVFLSYLLIVLSSGHYYAPNFFDACLFQSFSTFFHGG